MGTKVGRACLFRFPLFQVVRPRPRSNELTMSSRWDQLGIVSVSMEIRDTQAPFQPEKRGHHVSHPSRTRMPARRHFDINTQEGFSARREYLAQKRAQTTRLKG